jgi:serine protease Do
LDLKKIKTYSFLAALSLVFSFIGSYVYFNVINPIEKIYYNEAKKSMTTSANELLLSQRMSKIFTSSTPTSFIDAAAISTPAVVYIKALSKISSSRGATALAAETGSGVFISSDGYIVTNYHVVSDAEKIEVMLNDNREYKAQFIGFDKNTDLALIKIEGQDFNHLVFGNSDSLQVGEWVIAVGNPFRLQSTVTAGIVSAKARNIDVFDMNGIESFIQTDAAVNAGNSGGALVNTRGELVGINTAIITKSGHYEGFSFAVPASIARKVVSDILQYGSVQRGWLGVNLESVDDTKAKALNLKEVTGVFLSTIIKDGAGYDAGLKSNDVIIALNGKSISGLPQFSEVLSTFNPGDKVSIEYIRVGIKHRTTATLRNQMNTTDIVPIRKDAILTDLGFELRDLDNSEKIKFKSEGSLVVSIYKNSKISNSKIEPGYIITKINGKRIKSANDVINVLSANPMKINLVGFYENYPGEFPYEINL